jgi:hypothetical protein
MAAYVPIWPSSQYSSLSEPASQPLVFGLTGSEVVGECGGDSRSLQRAHLRQLSLCAPIPTMSPTFKPPSTMGPARTTSPTISCPTTSG